MKLPNFMCRITGHKKPIIHIGYHDYKKIGAVAICLRCGKGYGGGGWNIPNALEQLRALYPDENKEE